MYTRLPGPAIRLDHLSVRLNGGLLFDDLSLQLPGGVLTALLGISGVGKTTLLRLIAGFAHGGGCVTTQDGAPLRGLVAYMGQDDLLFPWLTTLANVTVGDRMRGNRPDRARAQRLLDSVGLDASAAALPATLSGGMRQRVALARTLYEDRPIVLMDEPFSSLDQVSRARMQTLAAGLLRGRTAVLITHDPLEACRLAQNILVMSGFPAVLSPALMLDGAVPRAVDDPAVLAAQGRLMRTLLGQIA